MLEVSEIIYSILNGSTFLQDLDVKVQPIIANQETNYPMVNYAIAELAGTTKDGLFPYNISIRIYSTTYRQTLQIADAIYTAIEESEYSNGFKYNGTQEPQVDVFEQLYTQSNYQYKK